MPVMVMAEDATEAETETEVFMVSATMFTTDEGFVFGEPDGFDMKKDESVDSKSNVEARYFYETDDYIFSFEVLKDETLDKMSEKVMSYDDEEGKAYSKYRDYCYNLFNEFLESVNSGSWKIIETYEDNPTLYFSATCKNGEDDYITVLYHISCIEGKYYVMSFVGKYDYQNEEMLDYKTIFDVVSSDVYLEANANAVHEEEDIIAKVQNALIDIDMFDGDVTGVLDEDTINAIKEYQRYLDLSANGSITDELLEYLGVDE